MVETACHRFDGRVVAVTGGASGIGAACVRRFAEEGASVVVADVDEERGQAVAAELPDERAVFMRCDVSQQSDWQALRDLVIERWNRLDALHSNAFVPIPELDPPVCSTGRPSKLPSRGSIRGSNGLYPKPPTAL